jgi:hypothetical protein
MLNGLCLYLETETPDWRDWVESLRYRPAGFCGVVLTPAENAAGAHGAVSRVRVKLSKL